jgi:ribonuclease D
VPGRARDAPAELFDTELAARLAGLERVGLAALTEQLLGYVLEKHHSAADWSTRPLPPEWLTYAALDVELLVPLRESLATELDSRARALGRRGVRRAWSPTARAAEVQG